MAVFGDMFYNAFLILHHCDQDQVLGSRIWYLGRQLHEAVAAWLWNHWQNVEEGSIECILIFGLRIYQAVKFNQLSR